MKNWKCNIFIYICLENPNRCARIILYRLDSNCSKCPLAIISSHKCGSFGLLLELYLIKCFVFYWTFDSTNDPYNTPLKLYTILHCIKWRKPKDFRSNRVFFVRFIQKYLRDKYCLKVATTLELMPRATTLKSKSHVPNPITRLRRLYVQQILHMQDIYLNQYFRNGRLSHKMSFSKEKF